MWSNDLELKFLECYQNEPVLWNARDPRHKDNQYKHDAWTRIHEQIDIPVADLKKKRDSLMATYRSHKRKIKSTTMSGAGGDSVHKPIWFAFDLMESFLCDVFQCRKTIHSDNTQNPPTPESIIDSEDVSENTLEPTTPSQLPSITRRRKNPLELEEAGKTMKEAMNSLNKVLNKPQVVEDDFDRYGKILANKLRKLSESDSLKVMYEIDGLFIKQMGNTFTHFTRPSPTHNVYSEPIQRQLIPHPTSSPSYYMRSESSCTSYSDSENASSIAVSNPSTIQILSNELLNPPIPEDVIIQAFHRA